MQFLAQAGQVLPYFLKQGADGFCAHADLDAVFGTKVVLDLLVLLFRDDLLLFQAGLAGIQDDEAVKVQHLFEVVHGHVEKGADLGGQGLQKPDVGHRGSQLDVSHALAAHLGSNDLDAAFFADNAAVLHALVLAAVALVVLGRSKDTGTEQAVALGLEGAVVNGLGLLDLAVGPLTDDFRGRYGNLYGLQVAHIGDISRSSAVGIEIVHAHILYIP